MPAAALPKNEPARLAALRRYAILDTPPEECFDRLVRLAAQLVDAPIAMITLIDEGRQWFKAKIGIDPSETPLEYSLCAHAILHEGLFVVSDTTKDARLCDNPTVTGDLRVRFYAAVPLKTRDGFNLGTLCVADRKPRPGLSPAEQMVLIELAAIASAELEQRQLLQTILQSVKPNVIFVAAASDSMPFKTSFVSANIKKLLGYEPEQFLSDPYFWGCHLHPEDAPRVFASTTELFENGHAVQEYRFRHNDGTYRWIYDETTLNRDSDGKPTSISGYWSDITARKDFEDKARRNEEQLRQVQKLELVGQLTGGIAHDFNNLLAVILGSLEFVADAATRGITADQELIDAAIRAGRRGHDLVRRLLSFSRQMPLKSEPTLIDQLVLDTLRLVQRTLGEAIEIETHFDAGAAMALIDRDQFVSALINLALNARDAMPKGGTLRIETTIPPARPAPLDGTTDVEGAENKQGNQEVCITVRDTGEGMTPAVREHAVEPFFTTKAVDVGSGLGLSMVYGFVRQSGGKIAIDSEVGEGTTITIRLPLISAAVPAGEAVAIELPAPIGDKKIVLLVEDDPDVRTVTTAQLIRLGFVVREAVTGIEALDLLASPGNIDIVLSDVVLPGGIDGITLATEARRVRPKICILCMSGYAATLDNRERLVANNIRLLSKPFSAGELAQALASALA